MTDDTTLHSSYRKEVCRPLVSLAFVSPLLLGYELGVLVLGPQALRNGADVWLRCWLDLAGFGQYFLLPLLTCSILLGWHHLRGEPWTMSPRVLPGMLAESALLAAALLAVARLHTHYLGPTSLQAAVLSGGSLCGRLIGYCGAGIYEELLFRLMLFPALLSALKTIGLSGKSSFAWSVVISSLVFSLAHYEAFTGYGYPFDWYSFTFRSAAGVFFALVFAFRGFGVAAGCHALYDVLVEFQ